MMMKLVIIALSIVVTNTNSEPFASSLRLKKMENLTKEMYINIWNFDNNSTIDSNKFNTFKSILILSHFTKNIQENDILVDVKKITPLLKDADNLLLLISMTNQILNSFTFNRILEENIFTSPLYAQFGILLEEEWLFN